MSEEKNIILERMKEMDAYEEALGRVSPEERPKIEKTIESVSMQFSTLIDKLFCIAQDPKLSAQLKEELLRMSKDPKSRKREVTENGES